MSLDFLKPICSRLHGSKSLRSGGGEYSERMRTMDFQKVTKVGDKAITGSVETVRSHPGITALMGLGIGWLILDRALKRRTLTEQLQEETRLYVEKNLPRFKEAAKEAVNISVDKIAGKSPKVVEAGASFINENPFLFGFMGLSTGLILGVLTSGVLNRTDFVDEARRNVKEKTGQVWHGAKERAEHAIDAVRHAV